MQPTRDRVNPEKTDTTPLRRPPWIRVRAPSGETYEKLQTLMRQKSLHTVCEEAGCPNMGECWGSGTATFLMMGDVCTRTCGFCDIKHGRPAMLDFLEPERVAQSVKAMNLKHAVITSVNRDDRRDGGAPIFAMLIHRIREIHPGCSIEVLIPDFKGSVEALRIVVAARPEILNHNVETVPRLYPTVRPEAIYERSLAVLRRAVERGESIVKTGCMVGLGEKPEEVHALLDEVAAIGVRLVTIGQYLRPSKHQLPVVEYVAPEVFDRYAWYGEVLGLQMQAAPFVRSSFHAGESFAQVVEDGPSYPPD